MIDNCPYTYDEIANNVLPSLLKLLLEKQNNPIKGEVFARSGFGYKRTLEYLEYEHDFPGCYVMFQGEKPMYVGISKNVITRLWNHFNAKNHYGSNLVYKVACGSNIIQDHKSDYKGEQYRSEFDTALNTVQKWSVIFQEVPDHVTLYLFEVYVAMHFDTSKYNSFKTH